VVTANLGGGDSEQETVLDGEIFTDGKHLLILTVTASQKPQTDQKHMLLATLIGPMVSPDLLRATLSAAKEVLGVPLEQFSYKSSRFDGLNTEGRERPAKPAAQEITASEVLSNRTARSLATGGDPISWTVRLRYFLSSVLCSSFFFEEKKIGCGRC
jgi:hypothetical protein